MEQITKYTDYKLNEKTIEIEDNKEGVYVLTLQDIITIVKNCSSSPDEHGFINDDIILDELKNYKFVKVEDPELIKLDTTEPKVVDELSSDDEDPTLIKKFEQ